MNGRELCRRQWRLVAASAGVAALAARGTCRSRPRTRSSPWTFRVGPPTAVINPAAMPTGSVLFCSWVPSLGHVAPGSIVAVLARPELLRSDQLPPCVPSPAS